jgi:hypothetical protein
VCEDEVKRECGLVDTTVRNESEVLRYFRLAKECWR